MWLKNFQKVQLEIANGKDPMQAYGAAIPLLSNVKLEGLKFAITGPFFNRQTA